MPRWETKQGPTADAERADNATGERGKHSGANDMKSFLEIEQLVDELEGGTLSQEEAVRKLAEAQLTLIRIAVSFQRIRRRVASDPEVLNAIRRETMTERLFGEAIDKITGE